MLADAEARGEALAEYERAVALRPHDYALWLDLGRAREQVNEPLEAVAAFREAARLAPFYAAPRWQLGNTLYRMGQFDEAFAELRHAVSGDSKLLPQALALAWAAFGGDPHKIEQALQPQTPAQHLALARFFVKHGKVREAIAQFRAGGDVAGGEERRALLAELLTAKRFAEAFEVWASWHPSTGAGNANGIGVVLNGGFEAPVTLDDPGFGWQLPQNTQALQAAQDTAEPRAGAQSLRLVWNGTPDATANILSQLILVEPGTHYQLRFAARTEKLVTGGLPVVLVTAASEEAAPVLGTAMTLPQGTSPWQDYTIDFKTPATTTAVQINVQRQSCSSAPCPIFGRVWFDEFSMR